MKKLIPSPSQTTPRHRARIAAAPQKIHEFRAAIFGVLLGGLVLLTNFGLHSQVGNTGTQFGPSAQAAVLIPPELHPPVISLASSSDLSSKDLQKVLTKWVRDNKGITLGAVVQELGGQKRSASVNPNTLFHAASLYKLYLADYVYTKAAKKQLSVSGHLSSCLRLMIVISDNYCAESIGWQVGWINLNNFVHGSGFSHTVVSPYNTTSASDVAKLLSRLHGGKLINAKYTHQLLGYMSQQIFRSGVPAGIPHTKVADKVGFVGDVWHDAAIVYHPKGDYILVVMTKNGGTSPIRDLSQRVSKFMNQ